MKPVDMIVLLIAFVVCLVILLPMVNLVVHNLPVNSERSEAFTRLLAGLMAIISLYVGSKLNTKDDDK